MQLGIILTSLQDNSHVASLLGLGAPLDANISPPSSLNDTHLAEVLMKTILKNLGFHSVSTFGMVSELTW
jgi:E3 ubiquitin-protein ligase HERC1